jgi:hypothetical protein
LAVAARRSDPASSTVRFSFDSDRYAGIREGPSRATSGRKQAQQSSSPNYSITSWALASNIGGTMMSSLWF